MPRSRGGDARQMRCDNRRAVEVRILGPLEVVAQGHDVTPTRAKERALLALLLLQRGRVISNDALVDALWGEAPPPTAGKALHGLVSGLRKVLGPDAIETRAPGYSMRLPPERTDLGRFEGLVGRSRREPDPEARSQLLATALAMFRGEALADFRNEEFARDDIARIDELRIAAETDRVDAELELGRHAELVPELERLVSTDPLRERPRAQLMLALYRGGRQADALHAYHEGRRVLAEQLGLDPGPVLQDLERRILVHDASLAPPVTPPRPLEPATSPRRERRVVTILCCGLTPFPSASPQPDPEDLQAIAESCLARAREEAERFGAAVEESVGGAVIVLFGAPVAHEDDAERAVRAAIRIRDRLASEVEVRIGVETGEALVELDGNWARALAGEVLLTAPRLQAAAPPGAVVVGETTRRGTSAAVRYREAERTTIGGRSVPAWEALSVEDSVAKRSISGGTLVGRGRDLDQLGNALDRVRSERVPHLVTVLGAPGIGKTRLVRELYSRVEAQPEAVGWLEGRSLPYGEGVSFWALGEIVKSQAGIFEGDPAELVSQKVELTVAELLPERPEAKWVVAHLGPLLGLAGETDPAEAFAAWRIFLEACADEGPLVLVFEDVHWADDGLLSFISELVDRAVDAPILVIATARPELLDSRPGWGGGMRNATTMSLRPLSDAEAGQLLSTLLGGPASARLIALVDGNPLFAEEYARLALEVGDVEDPPLPESLQAVIAARLETLSADENAIIQDAAVVGEVAWAGAVAAIGGRPPDAVEELIRSLERKQFMTRRRRSTIEGQTEYAFRHVLVRDVVYGRIPRDERGRRHRLAAEWIESLGRAEDHAELLAHHYGRSLELARAARLPTADLEERTRLALKAAGDRALALGAFSAARSFLDAARDIWPEADVGRARLLLSCAQAAYWLEAQDAGPLLDEAREALIREGDLEGAAEADAIHGELETELGNHGPAFEFFDRAWALLEDRPLSREKAEVLGMLANYGALGGRPDSVRLAETALAMAEQLGLEELRAVALRRLSVTNLIAGNFGAAIRLGEEALDAAVALHLPAAVRACGNLASLYSDLGDLGRARDLHERALELARRVGGKSDVRWLMGEHMLELYFAGDWDAAMAQADVFIAEMERSPIFIGASCRAMRAWIRLARGDIAGALDDGQRAAELGRRALDFQVLAPGLATEALCLLRAGRADDSALLVRELMTTTKGRAHHIGRSFLFHLAITAHELGLSAAFSEVAEDVPARTPWVEAGLQIARADWIGAAEVLAAIGALPESAFARLEAGRQLCARHRAAEARIQLELALDFFRRVGATAYVREAETML
jgi:DNA-binding SARP family transcriptional activator/class 3 adenylate cyclase/tetratricopeptide (TPR) repeat protein